MIFANDDYDVVDEVKIGTGTHLRLIQTHKGNRRIESWSNMTKQWNTMYRYGVDEAWSSWKRVEATIKPKKKIVKKKAVSKSMPAKPKTTRKPRKKKNDQ